MLSILTLNTGLFQIRFFGRPLWEPVPEADIRLHYIIQGILKLKPDIVCLQEVYQPFHRKILRRTLKTEYPHIVFSVTHGNIIFSKYPVPRWHNNFFNKSFWIERLYTLMGFVHCTVATPYGKVRIANIHTTCGAGIFRPDSLVVKQTQKLQVQQLVRQVGRNRHNIILCGDFNAGPTLNPNVYHLLHKWVDVMGDSKQPTWSPNYTGQEGKVFSDQAPARIDHIFVPKHYKIISAKIVLKNGESDHHGVLAKVRI